MKQFSMMLDYEYVRRGRYPGTNRFPDWAGHMFKENGIKSNLTDFWGNPWIYEAGPEGRSFMLLSGGPDGIPGTGDDLKVTGP
jgi:general secretion pathway protein G